MFQTAQPKSSRVPRPVRIELRDGRVLTGTLLLSRSETASSLLGKASPFLTVKTPDGELGINRDMIAAILLSDAAEQKPNSAGSAQRRTKEQPRKKAGPQSHLGDDEDDTVIDPCRVLRVQPGATEAELKAAWKARMRQVHPDKLQANGADPAIIAAAEREAQRVNQAYDKLREARKQHVNAL